MSKHSPHWCQIEDHWKWALLSWGVFRNETDFALNARYTCWSCGLRHGDRLKAYRCHIRAKCEGGSCDAWNHHLLCGSCHRESEFMSGTIYWQWFHSRDRIERMLLRGIALDVTEESVLAVASVNERQMVKDIYTRTREGRRGGNIRVAG